MVTMPTTVFPTNTGPFHAKWSVQRSWSLMRVASFTAQREILGCRRTAVFGSDDVINLKRQQRNVRWDLAILTMTLGTLPDMLLKLSLHKALTARVQHA